MRYLLLTFCLLAAFTAQAQDAPMADQLRADGKIWVVITTVALVLAGFFFYLIRLDGKISKLEKHNRA